MDGGDRLTHHPRTKGESGMSETSIEWTDATWNPVAGCTVISPGCTNCYAMRMAARLEAMGMAKYAALTRKSGKRAVWTGALSLDETALNVPLGWSRPRMVFVNSMSDLFHEDIPAHFIERVWAIMARASQHTFQILTKRPERMADVTASLPVLANVWLGTSVENADYLWRLDALRRTRAAIRFVSFEPLLGSVRGARLDGIDWAIVGGESGPRARPMEAAWVSEIRDRCRAAGTAFFFKQWGGKNKKKTGRMLEGRTWDEFPAPRRAAVLGASLIG
jgi:protein gp37